MKIERPLYWQQGQLLQPQHFQLQERAFDSRLAPLFKHGQPHFWGVAALEIDEEAIAAGVFRLHSGEFLFPDGSFVQYPGNGVIPPRLLAAPLPEGKPLLLYLGLRRWQESGANVAEIDESDDLGAITCRYLVDRLPEEVGDLHGNGPQRPVRRLTCLLRVFREDELTQGGDYLLLPVARLEELGGLGLSKDFIPPSLSLKACQPLKRLVGEIRDQLSARCHQLEQYKRQRGVQNADFGSRDMVYLLALRTLNRYLPQLFHLCEAPSAHPWVAYGVLRQLIGELSSFSLRVNFLGEAEGGEPLLPPYDHKRLRDCFDAVQRLIARLLDELTAGPDYVVRLENDGSCFCAELAPAMFADRNRYFLALKTADPPQHVHRLLIATGKLSAKEHLPTLTSHALPGLPLSYLDTPPAELPRRAGTLYFAVDHRHDQWEFVAKGHNIALNWDKAPADLAVELMVVERT